MKKMHKGYCLLAMSMVLSVVVLPVHGFSASQEGSAVVVGNAGVNDNKVVVPPVEAQTTEESDSYNNWWMIGGVAGAATLGLVAVAGSSGGSSSSSGSNSSNEPPVGADIGGSWSGYYTNYDGDLYEPLTATVTQNGSAVEIRTTKDAPPGQSFHGTIYPNATMTVYDDSDGEDWTSLSGPESSTSLELADYVFLDGQLSDTNYLILKR